MAADTAIFCPLCCVPSTGVPVLAPMKMTYVMMAPARGPEHEKPPYYSYCCQRCGFAEIHKRALGAG